VKDILELKTDARGEGVWGIVLCGSTGKKLGMLCFSIALHDHQSQIGSVSNVKPSEFVKWFRRHVETAEPQNLTQLSTQQLSAD
jgi:hypothetical protein